MVELIILCAAMFEFANNDMVVYYVEYHKFNRYNIHNYRYESLLFDNNWSVELFACYVVRSDSSWIIILLTSNDIIEFILHFQLFSSACCFFAWKKYCVTYTHFFIESIKQNIGYWMKKFSISDAFFKTKVPTCHNIREFFNEQLFEWLNWICDFPFRGQNEPDYHGSNGQADTHSLHSSHLSVQEDPLLIRTHKQQTSQQVGIIL